MTTRNQPAMKSVRLFDLLAAMKRKSVAYASWNKWSNSWCVHQTKWCAVTTAKHNGSKWTKGWFVPVKAKKKGKKNGKHKK